MHIGTLAARTRLRRFDEGPFHGHTEYLIESPGGARPAPQAYLVHQAPGWTLPLHYHREEQFQVVVGGSGRLGRHALAPLSVHYASREAAYGPLVAGPDGLDYFTLRAVTDSGAWVLPEARAQLHRGLAKRQATRGPLPVPADLASLAAPQQQVLLPLDDTPGDAGPAAWLLQLPPGAALAAPPRAEAGAGRFHVVVAGHWHCAGQLLPRLACVFTAADEPAAGHAGDAGLALLVLQFPAAARRPTPPGLATLGA